FENKGIFPNIDDRYNFGIVTFRNGNQTDTLKGIFQQQNVEILDSIEDHAVEIPKRVLERYSTESRIFPFITSQREVEVLDSVLSYPSLRDEIEGAWSVVPRRELDRARASDRFVEDESMGDYPVYEGKNIYQFTYDNSVFSDIDSPSLWSVEEDEPDKSAKYRVRERLFNSGELKKKIYDAFDGNKTSKSQIGFVNDKLDEYRDQSLSIEDVLPDYTEYRIVFRNITNNTNERTIIATVIPKDVVCVHSLHTFSPYEINIRKEDLGDFPLHGLYDRAYDDRELFVIIGLLNSIPFDFLMRTKIDTNVVKYKMLESQVPRLTEGDEHSYSDKRQNRVTAR
ncbi:MAG: type II restriction endonuclease subunit M, partial [Candidatus Paceibacteria bacterium]